MLGLKLNHVSKRGHGYHIPEVYFAGILAVRILPKCQWRSPIDSDWMYVAYVLYYCRYDPPVFHWLAYNVFHGKQQLYDFNNDARFIILNVVNTKSVTYNVHRLILFDTLWVTFHSATKPWPSARSQAKKIICNHNDGLLSFGLFHLSV